ncbi:hypothetical protein WMY93_022780 [Mugilogobius chulae]|uniref:Uncharacterized protein n=1 Tax=Mugilogobius chulae TaxID=88201 RepID=A0AAW0NB05_9GOBI
MKTSDELKDKLQDQTQQKVLMEEQIKHRDQLVQQLKDQLHQAEGERHLLEEQIDNRDQLVQQLKEEIHQSERERHLLEEQNCTLEQELRRAKEQRHLLEVQRSSLEQELHKAEEQHHLLDEQIDNRDQLEEQINHREQLVQKLKEEIHQSEGERHLLEEQNCALEQDLRRGEEQRHLLEEQRSSLEKSCTERRTASPAGEEELTQDQELGRAEEQRHQLERCVLCWSRGWSRSGGSGTGGSCAADSPPKVTLSSSPEGHPRQFRFAYTFDISRQLDSYLKSSGNRSRRLCKSEPRLPLTPDLLLRCILVLRFDLSLECMFLLAFFGFFCCSEFAPSSSVFILPSIQACPTFLTPDDYTLQRTKTDQIGASFLTGVSSYNKDILPVEAPYLRGLPDELKHLKNKPPTESTVYLTPDIVKAELDKVFKSEVPSIPSSSELKKQLKKQLQKDDKK